MPFLTQAMNQFTQAPILGLVDLVPSPNTISVQILSTSTATAIQNGSVMKQVALSTAALPVVDICTGPTDGPVFGVIPYTDRKNLYLPGDITNLVLSTSFIYLKSSAAINAGDKVTATAATTSADPTVATVSVPSTQYVTGVALDTCTAANQLLRIRVSPSFNGSV
jgi:hypothetical protein